MAARVIHPLVRGPRRRDPRARAGYLLGLALPMLAVTAQACGEPATGPSDTAPSPTLAPAGSPSTDAPPAETAAPQADPADAASATGDALPAVDPGPPQPPPGYGILVPPVAPPTEDALTMHALAGYEVVAIYAEPDMKARKLGYLRIGQRLRATAKVELAEGDGGCRKGWHHLEGGGFACASKGLVVESKPPYLYRAPPKPRMDTPTPYDYAYVRRWNSPMYWRIPTAEERAEAARIRAEREAERQGVPPPGEPAPAGAADGAAGGAPDPTVPAGASPTPPSPDKPKTVAVGQIEPGGEPKPTGDGAPKRPKTVSVAAPVAGQDPPPDANAEPAAGEPGPTSPAEPAPEEPAVVPPLSPSNPWLEKGFFLSLAEKEKDDAGRAWWRTARGGYVEAKATSPYTPKDFQGQVLDEIEAPFGWAMDKPTKVYTLTDDGKLKLARKVEQRTFLDLDEEVEHGGKTYMRLPTGELVRKKDVRIPEIAPMPEGLQPWERWIDVDLSLQVLVAYEGPRPVFSTLVSTGRKGTEEEPFDTPTGRFRVRSKHVSTTMDGNTASDGNYSIQDVPWAMFFEGSYALHGAFWHRGFGYRRSHGCVNLGPSDAKWLFFWTTPFLPERWHGVHASEQVPGTTVVIHE